MTFNLATSNKEELFTEVCNSLEDLGFNIEAIDKNRPWGGFIVIDQDSTASFLHYYFPDLAESELDAELRLSPKILLVAPSKKLSWQYHHRRSEVWVVVAGEVKVITSDDDSQKNERNLKEGEVIHLAQGERHRIIGTDKWGILAEIWRHSDPENPSDEDDIVRVEDDFGRE